MSAFDDLKQRVWEKVKSITPTIPVAHADGWGAPVKKPKAAAVASQAEPPVSEYTPPPNPGKYEDLTRESKEVLSLAQETFEGIKFEVSRSFTEGFGINHSVSMGEHQQGKPPSNYTIMAHWTNRIATMFGMMSTQGELRGRYIHELSQRLNFAAGVQISRERKNEEGTVFDTEMTYRGRDFTATGRMSHQTAPQGEQTMASLSYAQGITENVAIGIETAVVPAQLDVQMFMAGKYRGVDSEGREWIASAMVSPMGMLEAAYTHTVSPKLRMSTTLAFQPNPFRPGLMPMWSVGYMYNFHGQITVKGSITNFKAVQALFEEHLSESVAILVSGKINYPKNQYQFGFGFQLGLQ